MKRIIEHACEIFDRDLAAACREFDGCRNFHDVSIVRMRHEWYIRGVADAFLVNVSSKKDKNELLALKDKYIQALMEFEIPE